MDFGHHKGGWGATLGAGGRAIKAAGGKNDINLYLSIGKFELLVTNQYPSDFKVNHQSSTPLGIKSSR